MLAVILVYLSGAGIACAILVIAWRVSETKAFDRLAHWFVEKLSLDQRKS